MGENLYFGLFQANQENKESLQETIKFITSNLPEVYCEDVKSIKASVPNFNVQARDKISYTIIDKDIVNKGEQYIRMEKKGSPTPVTTRVNVSLDLETISEIMPELSINYELTYYDKCVLDSLFSLMFAGNKYFSAAMIARNMAGKEYSNRPSAGTIADVEKSLRKMEYIDISIDISEEVRHFSQLKDRLNTNIPTDQYIIQRKLLNIEYLKMRVNGKLSSMFRLLSPPVLFEYAYLRNQFSKIEPIWLKTPVQKSKNILTIQTYLLCKISIMRNNPSFNRNILFESLYELVPDIPDKKDKTYKTYVSRLRSNIIAILNHWIESGFITDYKICSKGVTKYYSLEIDTSNILPSS